MQEYFIEPEEHPDPAKGVRHPADCCPWCGDDHRPSDHRACRAKLHDLLYEEEKAREDQAHDAENLRDQLGEARTLLMDQNAELDETRERLAGMRIVADGVRRLTPGQRTGRLCAVCCAASRLVPIGSRSQSHGFGRLADRSSLSPTGVQSSQTPSAPVLRKPKHQTDAPADRYISRRRRLGRYSFRYSARET
jgi:hypothetical protein